MPSKWITCSEAAYILDVDPATVRNWAKKRLARKPSKLRYAKKKKKRYYVSEREIDTIAHKIGTQFLDTVFSR